MAQFNLEDYETVEQRLERFWADHPEGRVLTEIEHRDERSFIVRAAVYFNREDEIPVASGFAEEIIGQGPVNKTSALENCETSAIGRALANCNYSGAKNRPSREEMEKVARGQNTPPTPTKGVPKATTPTTPETAPEGVLEASYGAIFSAQDLDTLREIWKANKGWIHQAFKIEGDQVTTLDEAIKVAKERIGGTK